MYWMPSGRRRRRSSRCDPGEIRGIKLETGLRFSYSSLTQDIICGPDAISGLGDYLGRVGSRRAMIVCGPSILRGSDVIQRVQHTLGERSVGLFSSVFPHVPVDVLQEAVAVAKDLRPDALVSVGGGSTHDTSKGIATLLAEGGDIHDYEVRFDPPDKISIPELPDEKIPTITVPTTMGAAEASTGFSVTDKALGRKVLISGQGNSSKFIFIDGKALATTPINILLSTAMGQFRIAVETVYSRRHNPISDALALHSIKMLVKHLPHCPKKDIDCLLNTKTAACMASLSGVGSRGSGAEYRHCSSRWSSLRRSPRRGKRNPVAPHNAVQPRGQR